MDLDAPQRVDWVEEGLLAGHLGLTMAPGRRDRGQAGQWARSLERDLNSIAMSGVKLLVCLVPDAELGRILEREPEGYRTRAQALGMRVRSLPFPDGGIPMVDLAVPLVEELLHAASAGENVAVHCRAGLGRSGTIAACTLVAAGMDPDGAIAAVRRARGPATVERGDQEAFVERFPVAWSRRERSSLDRSLGSLVAGAVGDALGAGIEFHALGAIRAEFGVEGVQDYAPAYGRRGAITDDTQMTLFTAEGLLRGHVSQRSGEAAPGLERASMHEAYLRWLWTQNLVPEGDDRPAMDGWLVEHGELHARRAPGNTCLNALLSGRAGTPGDPLNDSKGCGGVMRAAPPGLLLRGDRARDVGVMAAAVTHGHRAGWETAGFLAELVGSVIDGRPIRVAAKELLAARRDTLGAETRAALARAMELAGTTPASAVEAAVAIEQLGEGWIAEEALAIGLYAALVAPDLPTGLRWAVNHSGDSDSTGSIAGNLLGAALGLDALPAAWREELELEALVRRVALDLWVAREHGWVDHARYPPHDLRP